MVAHWHPSFLFLSIAAQQLPHRRHGKNLFVREPGQRGCQNSDLLAERLVLVDNDKLLAVDHASAALDMKTGRSEIVLLDGNPHFFRYVFQFLVDLFRFHENHTGCRKSKRIRAGTNITCRART